MILHRLQAPTKWFFSSTRRACLSASTSAACRVARAVYAVALCATTTLSVRAGAQEVTAVGAQHATRRELAALIVELEGRLVSNARGADRARAMAEIAAIKRRLEEGDFRVGNQFVVTITTDQARSDTVSVRDSLLVAIGNLPDASLKGVLRSEIRDRLSDHVGKYLRNALVRVSVLTRITIRGAVLRPGSYLATPDRPLGDVVMLAAGPAPNAKLDELEVSRSGRTVLSAKSSKKPLKEGRTLAQLDVQSGDDIVVPQKRRINWQQILQVVGIAATLLFALIQFLQFYYGQQE